MCAKCGKRRCPLFDKWIRIYGVSNVCYCTGHVSERFRIFASTPDRMPDKEIVEFLDHEWQSELDLIYGRRSPGPLHIEKLELPHDGSWVVSGPAIKGV